jgi:regulator of CtrA degradation
MSVVVFASARSVSGSSMINRANDAQEPGADAPVPFAEKYAVSPQFDDLFREGMTLVEDAASYLDGPGRQDAKRLTGAAGLAYSTESMRLTTMLMQIASWLLVRRSVGRGEMTMEEALKSRQRAKLTYPQKSPRPEAFDELPDGMKRLIEQCDALYDRVLRLDRLISRSNDRPPRPEINPVASQVDRLREAFETDKRPAAAISAKWSER